MDADIKALLDTILARIDTLAIEVAKVTHTPPVGGGGSGSGVAHAPPAVFHGFNSADGDWSQWTDEVGGRRYFNKDYWFLGIPGAQKGVELGLWGGANLAFGVEGESKPHLYVVTLMDPQPNGGNWRLATKSAADVGWMDGSHYMPDATLTGGQKFAQWDAAGRPSVSADGFILQRGGDYVTNQHGDRLTPEQALAEFKVG